MKVGAALTKRAARVWLADRTTADRRGMDLTELVAYRYPLLRHQREFRRKLEEIEEQVVERLMPLCEHEFSGMDDEERVAATLCVADALESADLSDNTVFRVDLDPMSLAREIRQQVQAQIDSHLLSEAGLQLFTMILDQTCYYLAHLVLELPEFQSRATVETLSRLTGIAGQVGQLLDRLPVTALEPVEDIDQDEEFRGRYFELVSALYDGLEILGITTNYYEPTITLTVAYLSLAASSGSLTRGTRHAADSNRSRQADYEAEEQPRPVARVEEALGEKQRVLLQGDAGAGKSTLVQWLAITAVRRRFVGRLSTWNGLVPFLIRLRDFAENRLPAGDGFLLHANAPQWGPVPEGWVHRVALAGHALFLVDGIDELPEHDRSKVRRWLGELTTAYPTCVVVVTSRPSERTELWLTHDRYDAVNLEPMTPQDVRVFIDRWHNALLDSASGRDLVLPCPREDIAGHQKTLLAHLDARPHLRALARNPLLCAMICALNLDRRANLPRDRMTLYEAALDMLLERRDAEKQVRVDDEVQLTAVEKRTLLRALAWWLNENNRAEMSREEAIYQLHHKIKAMPSVSKAPDLVLQHLLERSGLIRQPVIGRIDFVHRTFQEFLAAKEVVERDSIYLLINNAGSDLWRETVLMACAHATARQRDLLLNGIIDRAYDHYQLVENENDERRRLMMLAAACLEGAVEIPPTTIARVESCLHELLPPRSIDDVNALATVGAAVFRVLPQDLSDMTEVNAVLTVRMVALSNELDTFRKLADYAQDPRWPVQDEIISCSRYFDLATYVPQVLQNAPLFDQALDVRDMAWVPQLNKLRRLRTAHVRIYPDQIDDLSLVGKVIPLSSLLVKVRGGCDLTPLNHHRQLACLNVTCDEGFTGLPVLSGLTSLRELVLVPGTTISDLTFVEDTLRELIRFEVVGLEGGADITVLAGLTKLRKLGLRGCRAPLDLVVAAELPELERLDLRECPENTDLSPLAGSRLRLLLSREHRCIGLEELGSEVEIQVY